jgi:hypothetical protein
LEGVGGGPSKRHCPVIPGLSRNPGSLAYHFWIPGQARNDEEWMQRMPPILQVEYFRHCE